MANLLYSKMKDVLFGYDTDIHFENGDLMLTDGGVDFIEREMYKLLVTERGQWKMNGRLGVSPVAFAGEPNTRETAKNLETYIYEGLTFAIAPAQASVRVVPTDFDTIVIFIDVFTPDALELTVPFEFDYRNGILRVDRSDPRTVKKKTGDKYAVNDISNLRKPNKYWSRLSKSSLNNFA